MHLYIRLSVNLLVCRFVTQTSDGPSPSGAPLLGPVFPKKKRGLKRSVRYGHSFRMTANLGSKPHNQRSPDQKVIPHNPRSPDQKVMPHNPRSPDNPRSIGPYRISLRHALLWTIARCRSSSSSPALLPRLAHPLLSPIPIHLTLSLYDFTPLPISFLYTLIPVHIPVHIHPNINSFSPPFILILSRAAALERSSSSGGMVVNRETSGGGGGGKSSHKGDRMNEAGDPSNAATTTTSSSKSKKHQHGSSTGV